MNNGNKTPEFIVNYFGETLPGVAISGELSGFQHLPVGADGKPMERLPIAEAPPKPTIVHRGTAARY